MYRTGGEPEYWMEACVLTDYHFMLFSCVKYRPTTLIADTIAIDIYTKNGPH